MKITILSIFPKIFDSFLNESLLKKSLLKNKIKIEVIDFREYSTNKHKKVDDYPYGGSQGMVLSIQPIVDCLKNIKKENSYVILLSPEGTLLEQKKVMNLSKQNHIILICGRYEGFDHRIYDYVDEVLSIGKYILMGGEVAAMAIVESVSRLNDGVIKNKDSYLNDSFSNNLIDFPVYTRPEVYDNKKVPSVLLSGNHKEIEKWQKQQQIILTKKYLKQK